MRDNRHFIRFMNSLGLTVSDLARRMNISYATVKSRVENLNWTTEEYRVLAEITSITEEEILSIVLNRKTISGIAIPYAIDKRMAFEKLTSNEDFLRTTLECVYLVYGERGKKATNSEISLLKKQFGLKSLE